MTGIAPPAPSGAPGTSANDADDIASAGAAYLATLTDDEKNRPLAGPDDEEDDAGSPTSPRATPTPAEAATDVGEPITRETDGAEFNEAAGRWVLDGKFVAGAPPEGWEAPARGAAAPEAGKPAGAPAAPVAADPDAPAAVKVTLPGANGDLEVEVDDEIAETLQRLKTDAGRARALQRRSATLDQREAELEAHMQEMEVDPVGFHLNKMPREQQLQVARALLVEHMDDLLPDIDQLRDPSIRLQATRQLRDGLRDSQGRLSTARQVSAAVREVVRATEELIPLDVDAQTAEDFIADARRDLARAADAGQRVNRETVKQLLARRLALYGFDKPKPQTPTGRPAAAPAPAAPPVPTARPATDRARDIAARRPAPGDAAAAQARIRRTQAARAAAGRVPSVGAGAAPTQTIAVPPEAEADIASMSKHLRKSGLPQSWAGVARE